MKRHFYPLGVRVCRGNVLHCGILRLQVLRLLRWFLRICRSCKGCIFVSLVTGLRLCYLSWKPGFCVCGVSWWRGLTCEASYINSCNDVLTVFTVPADRLDQYVPNSFDVEHCSLIPKPKRESGFCEEDEKLDAIVQRAGSEDGFSAAFKGLRLRKLLLWLLSTLSGLVSVLH